MTMARYCVALLLLAGCVGVYAAGQATDHPLVGRYAGSELLHSKVREFDEYNLPLGKLEDGSFSDSRRLEGKITWIGYRNPEGRSSLEVFRNYQEKLADEDFETLYSCESIDTCGYWFGKRIFDNDPEYFLHPADTGADEEIRYLVAERSSTEGKAYAQIVVYDDGNDTWSRIRVIEQQARDTDKIIVKADEMAQTINESGSVALYGLYFATDKATIKPDSRPALDEIGKLLNNNPDLKLLVVGHTDNQGDFSYNIDLSKRRAASVAETLIQDYEVNASRLKPWGVGYTAPVASNNNEQGRARNRRVELVAQ